MVKTFSRFTFLPACWTEQLGIKILNSNSTLLEIFQSHTCSPRRRGQRQGQGNDCVSPAPEKGERCRLAPSLCWCAFHTSRPLFPRKITEKAKNWSDWLSIEFCLKQILCCLHVLHNFSVLFHLFIWICVNICFKFQTSSSGQHLAPGWSSVASREDFEKYF